MSSAPVVYKSTDGNAPVIAGNDRTCLVNLLNKCLVTGYGDRPAAGWTMPFVNAEGTIAAFRNSTTTGTGFFLKIDQTVHATYPYQFKVNAFEAMSSEVDGTLPFGELSYSTNASNTSNSTVRPWLVVANENWAFVNFMPGATTFPTRAAMLSSPNIFNGTFFFFGDIEKINASDGFACMFAYTQTSSGLGNVGNVGNTAGPYTIARKLSGVIGPHSPGVSLAPPQKAGSFQYAGGPYTDDSGLICSKLYVSDIESTTLVVHRGHFNRLLVPHQKPPYEVLEQVAIDGKTYTHLTVCPYSSSVISMLIDMTP